MLHSHVISQTLKMPTKKQMCMEHTLLINTHLTVYRIMNWKNKHAHSDICYWQPENVEDTPHVYTYIHRSVMHTCIHIPTNQPRSLAQATTTKSTWIPLSPSLSVHKKKTQLIHQRGPKVRMEMSRSMEAVIMPSLEDFAYTVSKKKATLTFRSDSYSFQQQTWARQTSVATAANVMHEWSPLEAALATTQNI